MKRAVALVTALVLIMALAAFAQGTKKAAPAQKPVTKTATGTVKTVSGTALVITHKVSGKDEDMTFALSAATKATGDAAVGARATVHYTVDNNVNSATSVTYAAAKAPAATKKK
jgi:cytoskeletal protein RodZ